MKTLTARARALAAPKETLEPSPREADRLEKRIGPRPSQLTPLGLCLERALANMHVEYAARQVELIQGTFSQPAPGLLKFRGRPTSPRSPLPGKRVAGGRARAR